MEDAGGFGLVFLGIIGFLVVVRLPFLGDRGDGEESSVCTNLTTHRRSTAAQFGCQGWQVSSITDDIRYFLKFRGIPL
jgi:hypothetical protein